MNRGSKVKQPTNEPYFSFENFMFSNLTRVTTEEKECQICKRVTVIAYLYKDITYYSHYECLSLYFLYQFFNLTKSTHYSATQSHSVTADSAVLNEGDANNELTQDSGDASGAPGSGISQNSADSMSLDSAPAAASPNDSSSSATAEPNRTTEAISSPNKIQFVSLYDIYKENIQKPLAYDFYGGSSIEDGTVKASSNKKRRCYSCGIVDPHFKCFVQGCNNYMHVNCSGNGHMVVYTNPLVNLNVYTSLRNKPMNVIAPIIINSSAHQAGAAAPSEQEVVIDNYLKFNIIHVKEKFISYRFMLCYKHIDPTIFNNIKLLFLYRFMIIKEYQYVHAIINVISSYNAAIAKTKEDKKNRTAFKPVQLNGLSSSVNTAATPSSSIEMFVDKKIHAPDALSLNRDPRRPQPLLGKGEMGLVKTEFKRDAMLLRNRGDMMRGEFNELMSDREDKKNALMINNLMCEYNMYKRSNIQKNNKPFNPASFNILFQPTTLSINIDTDAALSNSVNINLVNIRDDEVLENDIRLLLNLSGQINNIHELKKITIQNEFNVQNVVQMIKQLLFSPKHAEPTELTHLKNINNLGAVSKCDETEEEASAEGGSMEGITEKDVYRVALRRPKFALLKLYNKFVWVCMTKLATGCKSEQEAVDDKLVILEYIVLSSMEYIYIKNIVNSIYFCNNSNMLLLHAGSARNNAHENADEAGAGPRYNMRESAGSSALSAAIGECVKGDVINLCGYSWDMNPPLYKFYKVHHSNAHSPTSAASKGAEGSKPADHAEPDASQNGFVYKQSIAILSALKSINNNIETYKKNIENNIARDSAKYNNLCFDAGFVNFYKNVSTALHRYNHFKQSIRRSILHYNPLCASASMDESKSEDNDSGNSPDSNFADNTAGDGKYVGGKTTDGSCSPNNSLADEKYVDKGGDGKFSDTNSANEKKDSARNRRSKRQPAQIMEKRFSDSTPKDRFSDSTPKDRFSGSTAKDRFAGISSGGKRDPDEFSSAPEAANGADSSETPNHSSLGDGYGSFKSSIGNEESAPAENENESSEHPEGEKVKITKEYCSVCLLSELSHKHILIQCQKCYLRIHYKCYYNYRLSSLLNNPSASPAPKDKEVKTGFYCDPCSREYNQRYETNYNSAICVSCLSSGGAMKAIYVPASGSGHSSSYAPYRSFYSGVHADHAINGAHAGGGYSFDSKFGDYGKPGYRNLVFGGTGLAGYGGGMFSGLGARNKNPRNDKKAGENEKWIHLICLVFLMPKVVCYDFVNLNQWYIPNRQNSMTTCSICGVVGGIQVKCTYSSQQLEAANLDGESSGSDQGDGDSSHKQCNGTAVPNGTGNACEEVEMEKCDCELTFHPMCCLLSGCYIKYSNKNNMNLRGYQLQTFMNNFFNIAASQEGFESQASFNSAGFGPSQPFAPGHPTSKDPGTKRNLDPILNNLFQSIILEPLCMKHTVELYTDKFVREQSVNRCHAYTHYLYHPDGFKNKKKYNSLPIEPIYSPVTITKNGPVKSQPRILPQHFESSFPVGVVNKRAKYNEPYLISVVYGLPKSLCGDVPKYGITAITNYLSSNHKNNNQISNNQAAVSQINNKEKDVKNIYDDKLWFSRFQQQYMINK